MTQYLALDSISATLREPGRSFRLRIEEFKLNQAERVTLTGASGSGKTLFLEVLALLVRPDIGGTYEFGNAQSESNAAQAINVHRLWHRGGGALNVTRGKIFGFVLQTGGLLPFLSVEENILLPQKLTGRRDQRFARKLIEELELGELTQRRPARLSLGQRQRVAIARALSHRPPFIIADEPTSALDPERSDTVIRLLREASAEEGAGVVLATHDQWVGRNFGERHHGVEVLSHAASPILGQVQSKLVALTG